MVIDGGVESTRRFTPGEVVVRREILLGEVWFAFPAICIGYPTTGVSPRVDIHGGSTRVEVATNLPAVVGVQDSKDRQGPVLTFDPDAWAAFTGATAAGAFDARS